MRFVKVAFGGHVKTACLKGKSGISKFSQLPGLWFRVSDLGIFRLSTEREYLNGKMADDDVNHHARHFGGAIRIEGSDESANSAQAG